MQIAGSFELPEASFNSVAVLDDSDELSSRAQGRPGGKSVYEALTALSDTFRLANGVTPFSSLDLSIPGAGTALAGNDSFRTEACCGRVRATWLRLSGKRGCER